MAASTHSRPDCSCSRSRNVKARPAKNTPAGAMRPKPMLTTPYLASAQLAPHTVATNAANSAAKTTSFLERFSLEMSRSNIRTRLLSSDAGIDSYRPRL